MNVSAIGASRQWGLAVIFLSLITHMSWADSPITREYWLKNRDTTIIIRALIILIPDSSGKRIMAGQGKHLVVTDFADQQAEVTDLLTILDQPPKATTEDKQFLELVQNGIHYLRQQKADRIALDKKGASPTAAPMGAILNSGVNSFDTYKSTRSIYAEEDAKLLSQRRRIVEDATPILLGDLILKGIFRPTETTTMALLAYGDTLYSARNGGLFERNSIRVKGVTSQILKDSVILIGPDRIPKEIKFKSTL
jgi:hypothetical protein